MNEQGVFFKTKEQHIRYEITQLTTLLKKVAQINSGDMNRDGYLAIQSATLHQKLTLLANSQEPRVKRCVNFTHLQHHQYDSPTQGNILIWFGVSHIKIACNNQDACTYLANIIEKTIAELKAEWSNTQQPSQGYVPTLG